MEERVPAYQGERVPQRPTTGRTSGGRSRRAAMLSAGLRTGQVPEARVLGIPLGEGARHLTAACVRARGALDISALVRRCFHPLEALAQQQSILLARRIPAYQLLADPRGLLVK